MIYKILANAMGLGKTIMTIALLLSDCSKGCITTQNSTQICEEASYFGEVPTHSNGAVEKLANPFSFGKHRKHKVPLIGGGNLIICPMTLLSQWKVQFMQWCQHIFVYAVLSADTFSACQKKKLTRMLT
jgi:DNA repair protein RAD5